MTNSISQKIVPISSPRNTHAHSGLLCLPPKREYLVYKRGARFSLQKSLAPISCTWNRRIAYPTGQFATLTSCRGSYGHKAIYVKCDSTDSTLCVSVFFLA